MHTTFLLTFLQTLDLTLAIVYRGPRATSVALDIPGQVGWTPKPTDIVPVGALINQDSFRNFRRQLNTDLDTCGYVSGLATSPLVCPAGNACVYETPRYFGCCSTYGTNFVDGCPTYTGCYDYSIASSCTGECYSSNRVCENTAPYCAAIILDYTTAKLTHYDCLADTQRTVSVAPTPQVIPTSTFTPSSSSHPVPTSSITSSPTTTPQPTNSSGGSSINVDAIVGGVVGGVGGLLVIGAVIFFLVLRKRRQIGSQMSEIQT